MSRSRRAPYAVNGYGTKWKRKAKRLANRTVRRNNDVKSGGEFKKHFESWNICDFRFYCEKERRK